MRGCARQAWIFLAVSAVGCGPAWREEARFTDRPQREPFRLEYALYRPHPDDSLDLTLLGPGLLERGLRVQIAHAPPEVSVSAAPLTWAKGTWDLHVQIANLSGLPSDEPVELSVLVGAEERQRLRITATQPPVVEVRCGAIALVAHQEPADASAQ
jgi:hypothetical protein